MATNNSCDYGPTQYNIQTGGANGALNNVAPSATSGNPLCSQGASSQPIFSANPTVTGMTITGTPSAGTDATNVTYVTNAIAAVNPAVNVVAATTANLNATYLNGVSGVGATLTNAGSLAAFSIDGQNPTVGQRVLVKNQSTTAQNGVYTVTTVGSGAIAWVLTRALDYDQPSDINNTGIINVLNGTVNAGTGWVINSTVTTVGTDAITYTQFIFPATTFLQVANNLSDVASASTSRTNLGLTAVATQTVTQYDVLVGGASNAITSVGPGSAGQVLLSGGNAANPAYVTPTSTGGTLTVTANSSTHNYDIAAPVSVANGGSGRTTLTNHGVLVGAGTSAITQLAAGTSGQVLQSGGASADPAYSTPTYPSASGSAGQILRSDGTNNVYTTATYPASSGGSGKILYDNGTNFVESTPTFPASASATSRKIIVSDGTNWNASTETWATPGSSGNVLTSDGTNWTSAAAPGGGLTTITGTLTNSQIKNLHGTPVQAIAAPGSGKVIIVVSAVGKMVYGGSNVFTAAASQRITLYYGTSQLVFAGNSQTTGIVSNGDLTGTTTTLAIVCGNSQSFTVDTSYTTFSNVAINLYNPVSTEIGGNAANDNTVSWTITYYVVTI